jgi:hypothetical protein
VARFQKLIPKALFVTALGVVTLFSANHPLLAAGRPVTVVELFTSQGCSSCPPANANLIRIREQPGVLALSFGVTYWDHLGWKDIFGRQDYTVRQESYEKPLGESGAFTPQMVIDGRTSLVGQDLAEVQAAIEKAGARPRDGAPTISVGEGRVSVSAGPSPSRAADVWIVRYNPHVVDVPVQRGENTGRTLPHGNVVHDLVRLGSWSGGAATFRLTPAPAGENTAILVQSPQGGPILAAATD